ncbi:MAG: electron transfer flavoprotein subunit beta/FixA family protein, partial [Candidatus Thermoplasmatota archaeon]|nr:electron transfer flavoprotein subunit beta/FixA family protein [Candidatus Thermoplasmatota archaeon]
LTVGPADAKEKIKELLAMGADEAYLISAPEKTDYHVVSKLLAKGVEKLGGVDLVICGEASIDLFSGQVGPRVAGYLNMPQLTYAFKVTAEDDKITAERNMGDKMVTTGSSYPALLTVTKEINEPRLPSLMQILGSANKPLNDWTPADLDLGDIVPRVETLDIKGMKMERKNIVYKDDPDEAVKQLAENLAKDGVLG